MADKTVWSNWETQCVDEWMTGTEIDKFSEISRSHLAGSAGHWAEAAARLAGWLEEYFKGYLGIPCDLRSNSSPFMYSLITGAMRNVRWRELAAAWIDWAVEDVKEEKNPFPKDGDVVTRDGVYFHVWRGGRMEEVPFWVDDDVDDTWWDLLSGYREEQGREKVDAWEIRKTDGKFNKLKKGDQF